jgi:CHAT domain-containing protein
LVVVADGALNYVPFNTLPLPLEHPARQAGNLAALKVVPLLAAHEVVNLPSASLLARQRDELGGRASAPKALAVFADPVFSAEDARLTATARLKSDQKLKPKTALQPKTPASELLAATPAVYTVSGSYSRGRLRDGSVLPRLLFSGREAQEIAALTAPSERLVATGFEARRETVFSSTLKDYRILHFATHALLDTEQPAVSGIVLSLYSQAGTPQPGFLQLHEIYGLHLAADLVVLSACQTALGREIKGEGLIGLTRGFIQSGAPRVVASLWSVDDAATRDLMKHFYVGMLKQGKRPAAALRASQLALWRQGRPPYYWAAFTFQGEWR